MLYYITYNKEFFIPYFNIYVEKINTLINRVTFILKSYFKVSSFFFKIFMKSMFELIKIHHLIDIFQNPCLSYSVFLSTHLCEQKYGDTMNIPS